MPEPLNDFVRHEAAAAKVHFFNALLAQKGFASRIFTGRPWTLWVQRGETDEKLVLARLEAAWEDFEATCRRIMGSPVKTFKEEAETPPPFRKGDKPHA